MTDSNIQLNISDAIKNIAIPDITANKRNIFDVNDYISTQSLYQSKEGHHQLIVIGNGFDKACTLKSGYSDFFETRRHGLYPDSSLIEDSEFSTWGEYISSNGITVWDLILEENSKETLWIDIENAMKKWLIDRSNYIPRNDPFARTMSLINPDYVSDIEPKERQRNNWPTYSNRSKQQYSEITIARYILDNNGGKQRKWTEEKLIKYLLAELHRFEDEFSNYLTAELKENKQYDIKSTQLMIDIIAGKLAKPEDAEILISILNFNYTTPQLPNLKDGEIEMTNVHGRLGSEIIFGIDGKDCMNDNLAVQFTKTYRLLGIHTTDENRLFESVGSISNGNPINVIKFFGHSLGSPDYSYFQAIFDSIDLYGGNVSLIFYYRNHQQDSKAEETTFKRVTKLLNEYGKTMDNLEHGKNLMHKLLLEGRLSVMELPHVKKRHVN